MQVPECVFCCSRVCQGFVGTAFLAFGVGFKKPSQKSTTSELSYVSGRRKCLGEVLEEELRCSWRLQQSETHFVPFRGVIPQLLSETVVLFMVLLLVPVYCIF